ncbi:MAG: SUMF1/EgtB/PvdO family nonheme iron enzyme [Gammaproteobacteria bacterium]
MLAMKNHARENRQEMLHRLAQARIRTDSLFDLVRPDALYERPVAERHRLLFYLGHLEAFDWNLFCDRLPGLKAFAPEFDRLFAFGIDPVGDGLPTDGPADWPAVAEIRRYDQRVRTTLDATLMHGLASTDTPAEESAELLLNVAIEHRLMHAETLAYLLNRLLPEHKLRPRHTARIIAPEVAPGLVDIPAGVTTLGRIRDDSHGFGWDNEYDEQPVEVPAFAIDRYPVSNGEYLDFMAAGGYEERAFWSESDWRWRTEQDIDHPAFWIRRGNRWHYRGMFDLLPLPLQWPVYVSHAEASAYTRRAGKNLPTEAQWQRAAYGTPQGGENAYPWGDAPPHAGIGNFDFHGWDPVPVGAFPENRSAFGVAGLLGNGWEWTSTPFAPFTGFRPFTCYPGYSADFFDGRHYVLKGGSARTAACMLRRSFRNWFQPHYPYVYAGFRCVSNQAC